MQVAACGDMHVSNFGVYASAERNLIFAINDFDEVHPGPWEWDLKRLAASAAVAARFMGADKVQAEEAAQAVRAIAIASASGAMPAWAFSRSGTSASTSAPCSRRSRPSCDAAPSASWTRRASKGHVRALGKLTAEVDGEHRFVEDVPLIVRETHSDAGVPAAEALDRMLHAYLASLTIDRRALLSRYRIVDVARKVVGVGSVGTSCWVILLQGIDRDDPLFLQVKQANPSVLAPYVSTKLHFPDEGRRVVAGQRLIQGSPDIFLGWGEVDGGISTFASLPT